MRKILLMPILLVAIATLSAFALRGGGSPGKVYIEGISFIPSTTTSTSTSTTTSTTNPPPKTTVTTSRVVQHVSRSRPAPVQAAPQGGDFWERLANCESPTNSWAGTYKGYFQFSDSNVWNANHQWGFHYTPTASYGEQKAAAQYLAAHANPYGQWPVCWPRAMRGA